MITEEMAEALLVDLFRRRSEDRADPQSVLQTVRQQAGKPRVSKSRAALTLAVAAAVVAIAFVSTFTIRTHASSEAAAVSKRLNSVTVVHPDWINSPRRAWK